MASCLERGPRTDADHRGRKPSCGRTASGKPSVVSVPSGLPLLSPQDKKHSGVFTFACPLGSRPCRRRPPFRLFVMGALQILLGIPPLSQSEPGSVFCRSSVGSLRENFPNPPQCPDQEGTHQIHVVLQFYNTRRC